MPRPCCFQASVHPHACGEHRPHRRSISPLNGSSPRMWGTRGSAAGYCPDARFIPTHVGNTKWRWPAVSARAVHPHACGEHSPPEKPICSIRGSSPRMWGTPVQIARRGLGLRFIPTHVGNTAVSQSRYLHGTVHPHACGEHGACKQAEPLLGGSSPRMWGTRPKLEPLPVQWRFIPTHVGNTLSGPTVPRA